MIKIKNTLTEIDALFSKAKIDWLLTRNTGEKQPDDLDILIREKDFVKAVKTLKTNGYKAFSHDKALGGRIPGAQLNLLKDSHLKIDLHQDFTWRKQRYLDLNYLWQAREGNKLNNKVDSFLVSINIIFEKTYLNNREFELILKYLGEDDFIKQALKYKWSSTYNYFCKWLKQEKNRANTIFLPLWLVLFSYYEKFDLISFMYYLFFRMRYILTKTLPYE